MLALNIAFVSYCMVKSVRMMAYFTLPVEHQITLLLRCGLFISCLFLYTFVPISWHYMILLFRSSMIEAMMGQLQTCGHVEWYSLYCLQVTCLLMILILWPCIKKWAFYQFFITILLLFSIFYILPTFSMCRFQLLNLIALLGCHSVQWNW